MVSWSVGMQNRIVTAAKMRDIILWFRAGSLVKFVRPQEGSADNSVGVEIVRGD